MKNAITAALKGCATAVTAIAAFAAQPFRATAVTAAAFVAQPFRAAAAAVVAVALASASLLAQDGQWLTYSGSYNSHRFSPLRQIAVDNVARLRPVWVYQPPGTGSIECTPIVANGVMYVTSGPTSVIALDLRSGKPIWEWTRPIAASVLNLGFPRVNRGVAILDGTVYVGTLDGYLVALDAKAGRERWTVHVGDNPTGHSITAAPLIVDDKVIVGISGGEAGIRGFLDAYDAKTGKQIWRFWTVPSPGRAGQRHVARRQLGPRRRRDLAHRLVRPGAEAAVLGHGQPRSRLERRLAQGRQPLHVVAGGDRRRDRQGALAFPVHAARRPRLGRESDPGARGHTDRRPAAIGRRHRQPQRLLLRARSQDRGIPGRHAVREADLGERTRRTRPADRIPGMEPSEKGTLVYPSLQGSTNWSSPSYSPATDMLYVPVREMGSIYFKTAVEYKPGTYYTGGSEKRLDEESWGAVRALDAKTGKLAWDFRLPSPPWAGVMSTAGGLVFGGSNEGNFFALDATSGKPLWQFQTGGQIRSGPMSFLVGDKQHVAVAGGHAIFVFAIE